MPSKVRDVPVFEGDHLVFETAGAGGVGDPLDRDPEAVGDRNPHAHEANLYDIDAKYGDYVAVQDTLDYLQRVGASRVP